MPRSLAPAVLAALFAVVPAAGFAQSSDAAHHVAEGDAAYAKRRAPEALKHYLAALKADSTNADALWRASRTETELSEYDSTHADALLADAERHARGAVAAAPKDAHTHFALAYALGRKALRVSVAERLPYATEIHKEVTACLAIAPKDAPCLHVLGVWDAEYMRLGSFTREMANTMSGGKLFANATWEEAERNLKAAIEVEPKRAIHHLDLARIYRDQGKAEEAKKEYQAVLDAPLTDYNDENYRAEAKAALAK
ncbi:MAG: hypothetical protein IRY91_14565 [Gemmatimonadaceae bacterium]|nr:hypothetical protein [Gemmatimonadaceae bacterium]